MPLNQDEIPTPTLPLDPPPTPIVTPFWLDKGLWVMLLGPVLMFLSQRFGISLDPAQVIGVVLPLVAYIVMHKWKTAQLQKTELAGKAAVDLVQSQAQAAAVLRANG